MAQTARPTVAIIGYGAIGRAVAEQLLADPSCPLLVAVLVRSAAADARAALPAGVAVVERVEDLTALRPNIAVECAGQAALGALAPLLLQQGIDVMAISSGALAAPGVLRSWLCIAENGAARLIIPAGAIAGLDGLGAHKRAGLTRLVYTSTKPPLAWRGTPAEMLCDLSSLASPFCFFEGNAREAALAYPKNANLAATVALAGLGLDETRVRLVADPAAAGNTGLVEAESSIGTMRVEMAGAASANPKTSASTAYSIVHALATSTARLVI